MNNFTNDVYLFNKIGGTPQDQTYKNLWGSITLVQEELDETSDAMRNFLKNNEQWSDKDRVELLDGVVDIIVTALGIAYRAGFTKEQVEKAMQVVSDTNLNKFCYTEEDAELSVGVYADDERYKNVRYESVDINGQTWYIVIGETVEGTRKILKAAGWRSPTNALEEIVNDT